MFGVCAGAGGGGGGGGVEGRTHTVLGTDSVGIGAGVKLLVRYVT